MILALRNLTIRSRLTLLLTVLLVCMAGLSWYLTGVVRSTKDQVRQVYKEGALTVRYALETSAHMSAAEVALYRGMNADDPNKIAEYSATAFDESSKIGETNKQFAKLLEGTPEGRKLLSRCNQAFSAWEPLVSETANLIQSGANISMILESLNSMIAQSRVFKSVMDETITLTTKEMEAQEKALDARLAAAATTALVVTLAAAALALLVGMAIANSIAGPVKRTMTALDEAAESLDLTRRADESGRDELSAMSRSLNRLMERCQEALVSVSTLQGQVTEHAENFSAIAQQTSASVQEVRAGVGEAATQMDNLAAGTEQINASVGRWPPEPSPPRSGAPRWPPRWLGLRERRRRASRRCARWCGRCWRWPAPPGSPRRASRSWRTGPSRSVPSWGASARSRTRPTCWP